jgi:drug/metabolite transporter (DMT)-like permease
MAHGKCRRPVPVRSLQTVSSHHLVRQAALASLSAAALFAMLFVAATSIAAQLLMTHALAHVTAVASGIILQLTVVLALAGGVVLFGESLSRAELAGSLLTMCGVAWVVIGSRPPRPVAAPGPLATPSERH